MSRVGRVAGKVALITGASRGIGAETARLLALEGAFIILADVLVCQGKALADEVGGSFFELDVSDENAWKRLSVKIGKRHGRLDILFNNAGITGLDADSGPGDPENSSLDAWRRVHRVNLDGLFLGCKYGIGLMRKFGGSIINMSSRSGLVGVPQACAYASSKAAIANHTKSVALYCAEMGYSIRCNSVHPGAILTPMWDQMFGSGDLKYRQSMIEEVGKGVPLGLMGKPMDVAQAVLFLASDESKYITGAALNIDGGIMAGSSSSPKRGQGQSGGKID